MRPPKVVPPLANQWFPPLVLPPRSRVLAALLAFGRVPRWRVPTVREPVPRLLHAVRLVLLRVPFFRPPRPPVSLPTPLPRVPAPFVRRPPLPRELPSGPFVVRLAVLPEARSRQQYAVGLPVLVVATPGHPLGRRQLFDRFRAVVERPLLFGLLLGPLVRAVRVLLAPPSLDPLMPLVQYHSSRFPAEAVRHGRHH